jgi:hypothetical protein
MELRLRADASAGLEFDIRHFCATCVARVTFDAGSEGRQLAAISYKRVVCAPSLYIQGDSLAWRHATL